MSDILKSIEWACDAIRYKTSFGLDALNASLAREKRAKGVLIDCKEYIEDVDWHSKKIQSQKAKLIQDKEEMREEIESVRRENYNLKDQYRMVIDVNYEYVIRNSKLKTENKKLREALEKYANPNNWDNVNYPNMCILEGDCKEVVHKNTECAGGEIARQTLKEIEGENQNDK